MFLMVGRLGETGILLELQVGERKEECPARAAIGRTAAPDKRPTRDRPEQCGGKGEQEKRETLTWVEARGLTGCGNLCPRGGHKRQSPERQEQQLESRWRKRQLESDSRIWNQILWVAEASRNK